MAKRKSRIPLRSGEELDGLRRAGRIAAEVLGQAGEMVEPGLTTGELDRAIGAWIADQNCRSAFLGYKGFPAQACLSVNEEIVHGIGSGRVLEEGDVIKIDVGIRTPDGWVGDNAKSVAVGEVTPEAESLMRATEESLHIAIDRAKEGVLLSEVCASVEAHVEPLGYTVVKQFVGHGVGRDLHEPPQVPNYWDEAEMHRRRFKNPRLRNGMVLAIEPMVNAGSDDVRILDDDWTVITADRKLSAHYEHTIVVNGEVPEILTPRPRAFETTSLTGEKA